MGVGIDEAGGYAASVGIDDGCVGRNLGFEIGVFAGCGDAAVFDEHCRVVDDCEVVEFRAGARACGTGERDELADIDDGDHSGVCGVSSAHAPVSGVIDHC